LVLRYKVYARGGGSRAVTRTCRSSLVRTRIPGVEDRKVYTGSDMVISREATYKMVCFSEVIAEDQVSMQFSGSHLRKGPFSGGSRGPGDWV